MSGPWQKLALYAWGSARLMQLGRPDLTLGFLGGIGDDLLCTAAIEEWLQRGARNLWFVTRHAALYSYLDRRVRLIPEDPRYLQLARRLGRPMRALSYSTYDRAADRDTAVSEHIIADMCRRAGLTGQIRLRPHLVLQADELAAAAPYRDSLVVQASGLTAAVPMRTKQWPGERMQAVVDHFVQRGMPVVQLGSAGDPALSGATDLRGKTSLRASAAVLAGARLFVGLVGFPMHLARAVDCPAVIVYGGREPPELTGYSCNLNLTHRPPCAPCWQRNRCDYHHACMTEISAATVIAAVEQALARPRGPLTEEIVQL
ncbi:MAG: glycosyltransferase family 9 protein [Verrucomicrobia bacterium]|nr:glycosyltransferase family 9 protein [Verrucomicrobiota bacterium]